MGVEALKPGVPCRPAIDELLKLLPAKSTRQTMLFSATFPRNIEELARYALRPGYALIDTIGEDAEQTADKVGDKGFGVSVITLQAH